MAAFKAEADRLSAALCQPNWRPSRAHVEQARNLLREAADEIERLQARLLMAEGCSSLATVGVDAHGAVVELSKETMGKLIAAEKEVARLSSELRRLVPGYHD